MNKSLIEPQAFTITVGEEAIWKKAAEKMFSHLQDLQEFIRGIPESANYNYEDYENIDTIMRDINSAEINSLIEVYVEWEE
jgi:hypothetical protein